MFDELHDLYQQVILDHSRSPRNYGPLPDANRRAHGRNPLCGDNVTVSLRMDGERIDEIRFEGTGCAIARASASVMTSILKGKTRAEVQALFDRFHELVKTGKTEEAGLGKLDVFAGVHKFPARVKCAILCWHAVMAAMAGEGETVTTE
jgi:nitrogen fixation protein NifU and related proteins